MSQRRIRRGVRMIALELQVFWQLHVGPAHKLLAWFGTWNHSAHEVGT